MISGQAQDSIERIFYKAAQARLPLDAGDSCRITPRAQHSDNLPAESEVVVLTISSILFRLLLILHLDEDATTREYFVKDGAEHDFREAFLEVGNLCCGAINQELLPYFPDLGMSTPYVLSARCVPHLRELKPGYLASYTVTINQTVEFAATLCLCAYGPIDFVADLSAVVESSGELELF